MMLMGGGQSFLGDNKGFMVAKVKKLMDDDDKDTNGDERGIS